MKTFLTNPKVHRLILIVVVIFLLSQWYVGYENQKQSNKTIEALQSENKTYKLKSGQNVTSQQIAELTENQLEQQMKTDLVLHELSKEFAKLKSVKTATVKMEIPKTSVAFETPITTKDIDTTTNELKFERSGAKFDKWFEFGYKVTQDSLTIEPFSTWTEVKIVDGFKRKWFLGKQTYTSDILFTNPYLEASQVKAYQVTIPKKWHETRLFNIGVGYLIKTAEISIRK